MACKYCGGELIFRYIDGVNTPIHLSPYGCDSGNRDSPVGLQVHRYESFTNPNAKCPVCSAPVFFYRSPDDGRVFFDALGPPWPKHPCTSELQAGRYVVAPVDVALASGLTFEWQRSGWEPFIFTRVWDQLGFTGIRGRIGKSGVERSLVIVGRDPGIALYPVFVKQTEHDRLKWLVSSFRLDKRTGRVREVIREAREKTT